MAPLSCRDLPAQLPALPRRATAHAQLSFLRAPAPRQPLTSTASASTIASTLRLPLAATRDEAVASLVGHLEHDVAHGHQYRDDVQDEEEDDDARRRGARKHQEELPARWREIHGRDDWAGLLDPMDPLLRSELIRYGELAQACYDAFDYDPYSRYCGSCKYPRRELFERLGMAGAARGYAVSRYLYATSNFRFPAFFPPSRAGAKIWSQSANWIGYVAVSTDEESARLGRRDVSIAWRGTVTRLEWVSDLMDFLRPVAEKGIPCPDPDVKVLAGFADLYTDKDPTCRFCKYSAREQVLTEVRRLVGRYAALGEDVSITVTGHSLGSALAMLSARVRVLVRVGNAAFRRRFESELGVKALRVVNVHDNVTRMPGILVLLPRRRGAGARPQALAVPQGHAGPGVLPRPRGPPPPHRRVPRARGAVRAGERARPGAGEQGVRLPQGPPRRAPLLAPGREQGHGPRPRRALGAARPPRMAPGRPRPRRPEPPPPPPPTPSPRRRRPPPPSQPSKRRPRWCHGRRPVGTKMMTDMAATCARSHRPSKRDV
ncbi:phospholipase A1-Igamma1, chloroplastic-like isoform X2 [Panicum miliaceum]|uniref:Phospholipase A1-Igamma1, chloroplastic-like isoform X2 n=1 Tax=Panicum miliaceum TaxID=4540 RepID=A0A3L6RDA2_PANMI|nr:phospholipase A1-Igamma1, chloroplastic-like isoform X2 [Panicum miliaceum]